MWSFDLSQYDQVWKFVLGIILLMIFLLIGNVVRRVIPFLRKAFLPSALIGGLLLLLFNYLMKWITGDFVIDQRSMQIITYHSLAIGFIAMSLKSVKKEKDNGIGKYSMQNGLLTGGTYMLQAVVGLLVSLIFFWLGFEKFYDAGIILPLGFGQGPGNALTWDINFSNIAETGFQGNGSFGLTIASVGFIVASIFGVLYINFFKHKGEIIPPAANQERHVREFEDENEIEDSESVDKTSIQISFVALSYALAFLIMLFFSKLTDWTGVKLFNSIAWGFNFIFGVVAATLVKVIVNFLRKKNIMHRQYINNYQMDRISGFAFDLMIVAGVAAIDIEVVSNYIWLIIFLALFGTVATFIYIRTMSKVCFKGFEHEAFLANFGALTGTASNGMILLREIDPNYQTPMSSVYIVSQFPAMLFVAPLLLLLDMGSKSLTKCLITFGIFLVLFVLYTTFMVLMAKGKIGKKQAKGETE